MAITLESNSVSEQELKDALTSFGLDIDKEEAPGSGEPAKGEETPVPKGEPGAKAAAEPEGKSEAGSEPVDKSQETPPETKAKGGWQRKVEKLTAQLEGVRDQLEEKTGNEAKLRQDKLDLERKIAELSASGPDAAPKDDGIKRPVRPTLAGMDYDNEKLEAAMADYDEAVDKYTRAISEKTAKDTLEADRVAREKKAADEKAADELAAFGKRVETDKEAIPDYQEVLDELPKGAHTVLDSSDAVVKFIKSKTKIPAALIHYFAKDLLDNDGAESTRLEAMDEIDQVLAMREIESNILQSRTAKNKPPEPAAPAKAETRTPEPPVKERPKPQQVPDAPLETLGGRGTSANAGNLDRQIEEAAERGDGKEVRRLRSLQQVAAARAAGRIP